MIKEDFKGLKHIYYTTGNAAYKRPVLMCVVNLKIGKRQKYFEIDELCKAKKWVDLQLIRFGKKQVYNTYKRVFN